MGILPLVGYCLESRQEILVYDYMSQGTLNDHLHHAGTQPLTLKTASTDQPTARTPLSWKTRLDIVIGSARSLEYLPKEMSGVSTAIKGTIGYLDPEYASLSSGSRSTCPVWLLAQSKK
ncbi:hypothetical protein AXG93_4343s1570 [Marchantia polymorpha subsp. ruderalis]|uniref:Serine-threonine/tyrosine-protein kinase catalytic domain-containing protein n=1 Tax=Marchantia polymorpha subsp. ruderalis TaxID=1480154 RepID=A0A176VUF9_MARPO|nr:hypothetical protein AXG93_4343s1570 [Marchantia polymorpha subsp. ruderalis]